MRHEDVLDVAGCAEDDDSEEEVDCIEIGTLGFEDTSGVKTSGVKVRLIADNDIGDPLQSSRSKLMDMVGEDD